MARRPTLPWTIAPGCVMTAAKVQVLRQLALCGETGSGAVAVAMPRGTLAILVQFGVAEHAPALADMPDERRYRVTQRGREVLAQLGLLS